MSEIPWWGLPLIAALFALAGAATAQLVSARTDYLMRRRRRTKRWYAERKAAYVELLAVFERDVYRLRAASEAGDKPAPGLTYIDEVGPALMQVRLLATGPVRSAALAVHLLLQKLHGEMNPSAVPGVRPGPRSDSSRRAASAGAGARRGRRCGPAPWRAAAPA